MVAIKREFLSRNGGTSFFNEDGGGRGARKSVKFAVVIDFAFLYHPVKRARSCFAKKKKKTPIHRFEMVGPIRWTRNTGVTSVPLL